MAVLFYSQLSKIGNAKSWKWGIWPSTGKLINNYDILIKTTMSTKQVQTIDSCKNISEP